mgnify:CR=1 FL=1
MSNSNSSVTQKHASVFELNGIPSFGQALPLALQHVVAMIVGCVTPSIIVAGVAGINAGDRVILIQAALFCSAISTLLQLFPLYQIQEFSAGQRPPGHSGNQLRLCTEHAGDCRNLRYCHHPWSTGCGRRHCHHSRLLHQEDPSPFSRPL